MSRQLVLPLPAEAGRVCEVATPLGLDLRIDDKPVVRVRIGPRGWECHNLAASHMRVVPNQYEALAIGRRVVRMLLA